MGYRNYIGFIPKKEYNKIKSLTIQEIFDYKNTDPKDDCIGVYDFVTELYEFGKCVDFNPPKKSIKTFFKNKEAEKNWNYEGELKVVTKEFLAYIIGSYKKRVEIYYNDMMMPFFGKRDNVFDKEDVSNFLNSIKTEYGINNKHTFDFTKITDEEQTALFKIFEHIRSMRTEWTALTPYNLEKGQCVTSSWKFEYGIFELVRIYKSFDWKKNVMIYYGY